MGNLGSSTCSRALRNSEMLQELLSWWVAGAENGLGELHRSHRPHTWYSIKNSLWKSQLCLQQKVCLSLQLPLKWASHFVFPTKALQTGVEEFLKRRVAKIPFLVPVLGNFSSKSKARIHTRDTDYAVPQLQAWTMLCAHMSHMAFSTWNICCIIAENSYPSELLWKRNRKQKTF